MKSPRQQLEIKVRELVQNANKELVELQRSPSNEQGKVVFIACAEAMGALRVYHSVVGALPKNQFNVKSVHDDFMAMTKHLHAVDFADEFELEPMKALLEDA